ncbi:poly-gamma-glutamate biosynthesis protein PgsC [Alteribacter keqinensis]|uniref:Poly-gamma-glutamate biosynthesis protein PgsC n=1 Tax=Alteribacter keqinensis TaxID=2483800 RepID=A0A3M7TRT6_9BACI|nr:poly-gamma-glutamate biosynthesis protein PgsC [Alteribacter keqinensis]RNA67750.1 poly-gamma-glutamate biosynthesis protein PgsC [Alteribacter keqinensis]
MFVFDSGDVYLALIAGAILSLFYTEKTGVLPAGLVVPGYIAMLFTFPVSIAVVFMISFLTYFIVMKFVGRFTILYGRRKFTAMLTVAIILSIGFDYLFPHFSPPHIVSGLMAIGVIVPGLIANTIQKQGVIPTTLSTLLLSCATFGVVMIASFI